MPEPSAGQAIDSFDDVEHGDQLVYTGPDNLPSPHVPPLDRDNPYTFKHVSLHGTVTFETRFGGRKYLDDEHPANNPDHWRPATREEVSE